MKSGLENIDEVFKEAFEGFEADVDPSVWNNIQNTLVKGSAAQTSVQSGSNTIFGIKSLAFKVVAAVAAVAALGTVAGLYYFSNNSDIQRQEITSEVSLEEDLSQKESHEKEILSKKDIVSAEKGIEVSEKKTIENLTLHAEQKYQLEEDKASTAIETENSETTKSIDAAQHEKSVNAPSKQEDVGKRNESLKEELPPIAQKELSGVLRASVTEGIAPLDVSMDVEGENIVSYSWDFGDGSEVLKDESVFHTFYEPGLYTVKVIILDDNANSMTLIKQIKVNSSNVSKIGAIQKAFSPNGDGNNDVFIIKSGVNIAVFNAVVKKLNGEVVYQWNSIEEGWDGRDKSGRIMPPGPYILSVRAKGMDGKEHPINQVITLVK